MKVTASPANGTAEPRQILGFTSPGDSYSDGESENTMLEIFSQPDSQKTVEKILSNNPSWPLLYHLSPLRENLLSWYDFTKDQTLLEIGAGCGALTGLFCRQLKSVTAVELTERRAKIIEKRHREAANLTVYSGNLNDWTIKEKFDYATLIGVLEYAGKYTSGDNPYVDFLKKVRSFIAKKGTLILAIENKFGLKYWAGCRDDHTGKLFDSLEGYPDNQDIQTFGRVRIAEFLKSAGFRKLAFYYPLPDYKLPIKIFSDAYPPTLQHNIESKIFPIFEPSQERYYFFNEKLVSDNIIRNQSFGFFANSFLIFAQNS
jgi:hypothetical protein